MKASPKLAKEAFILLPRFRSYSHLFSARLFYRPLPCGFATPAQGRFFSRSERVDSPPILPKGLPSQAFRTIRPFPACPPLPRTNAAFLKWSSVCANPRKDLNLTSPGVPIPVGARKGQVLQNGHFDQHRYTHSLCKPIRDTDEKFAGSGSLRSCKPNGENIETNQSNETPNINSEEVICTQACQEEGSHKKHAFFKPVRMFRRFKVDPEGAKVRIKLDSCSKLADVHGALEVFDQVKKEQRVQLDIYNYNTLLYLCSGAASGSLFKDCRVRKKRSGASCTQPLQNGHNTNKNPEGLGDSNPTKVLVHFSPEDSELASARGADILEDMLNQGVEPNEATYTSIIRLAVAKNDGDLAFETIKLMESSGIPPKLRSYGPLLTCFCESKKADKAYEVDNLMANVGVQPDESMLNSLLKVSTYAGREDKVYALLHRLRRSVRDLLPTTVNSIEKWFTSEDAAFAGKGRWENLPLGEELRQATEACGGGWHGLGWLGTGAWQVRRTSISKTGSCLSCGEMLSTVDLDVKDTEDFANCIAKLACEKQTQPHTFLHFQDWLDKNGPFDAIVDGANVGLYNPRIYQGFNISLLNAVVNAATARFCTQKPPLVIIHSRHKQSITANCKSEAILKKWRQDCALYFTPPGSNDDWFWLYAAVKYKCMLVTNDQMRDHIFALLGNNFFPKWKERHQVRFFFGVKGLEIHMPPPYSTIIQESMKGSWHVPQAGDEDSEVPREWLCVTRASATSGL